MRECVFAGTFDPFTKGHEEVVTKCLKMFDKVIVAILDNHDKTPMFTAEERASFIEKLYKDNKSVEIKTSHGLLVDFMRENKILVNVRGIRNAEDFKYENDMVYFNQEMYPELITVYLPSSPEKTHVSSTAIRSLIRAKADISKYLPQPVAKEVNKALEQKGLK